VVAGDGSDAAIAINSDLVDDDVRRAVRDFNAGLPSDGAVPAVMYG
jgi:hypothetical protein